MRWLILTTLLLLSPLVLAEPSFNLQHTDIQAGETIFATIEIPNGEFTKEIQESDIKFLEGRKEVFFEHAIKFYEGVHYFYAYTTRQGNFTIKIPNILYKEAEELKSFDLEIPLEIKNNLLLDDKTNKTYTEILSIKPGFVFTSTAPKIKILNEGTSSLNITLSEGKTSIEPLKGFEVSLAIPPQEFSNFEIKSYKTFSVPIIYLGLEGPINQTQEKSDLRADPDFLTLILVEGQDQEANLSLFNFGIENITGIKISSDIKDLKISSLEELQAKSIHNLTLTFSPKEKGYVLGNLIIKFTQNQTNLNISVPLSLYILQKGSTVDPNMSLVVSEKTCEELSGSTCKDDEMCSGEYTFGKDGAYCCLASCVPKPDDEKEGGYGWLIGILLLLALAAAGYYFYRKSKKVQPKNPEEQIAEQSNEYEKRFNPTQKPNRISGGLQRD